MFRAGLLLIITVYTAVGVCHAFMLTACWQHPANSQHDIYQLLYIQSTTS